MKRLIILFFFLTSNFLYSQNEVKNPSFEFIEENADKDCELTTKKNKRDEFDKVKDWTYPNLGTERTPDVMCNGNSQNYTSRSGQFFGHVIEREFLIGKLKSKLDKDTYYHVEYWTLTDSMPKKGGMKFYSGRPFFVFTPSPDLEINSNVPLNQWRKVHKIYKPKSNNKDVIGVGMFGSGNSGNVLFDDFRIFKDCIPTIRFENTMFYQNHSYRYQSSDKIYLGENVDEEQFDGIVIFENKSKALFRATNDIILEEGININVGAEVTFEIKPCSDICPDPEFLLFPNIFSPNSNGLNDEFCIKTKNATKYRARIQNYELQSDVIKKEGIIGDSGLTCIWDGKKNGNYVPSGNYDIVIELINDCNEKKQNAYPVWVSTED